MRSSALAVLIALAWGGAASAQQSPSEVTDGEIAKYKAIAQNACREAGMGRGDAQEKVDGFCTCVIQALEKSMKRPEWQQAYFYSLKQLGEQEKGVLGPHLPKVAACGKP